MKFIIKTTSGKVFELFEKLSLSPFDKITQEIINNEKICFIELSLIEDLLKISNELGYEIILTPKGQCSNINRNEIFPPENVIEIYDDYREI